MFHSQSFVDSEGAFVYVRYLLHSVLSLAASKLDLPSLLSIMLTPSSTLKEWSTCLSSYDQAILAHSKTSKRRAGLKDLDDFVRNDLPTKVADRQDEDCDGEPAKGGLMIKEELCKIVEWKITVCFFDAVRIGEKLNHCR